MKDNMLGVMLDCSRGAVMTVDTVKNYADILAKMGYNTLMLYTEETYEIPSEPFFGYMRGRYTADELREIDAYCESIGIELVPCIQTLAHLEQMFRWTDAYNNIRDCDNILLADEPKTYELIEKMFKTCRECFKTDTIHIGMDEAMNVGLGKYLQKHGYHDRFDIINKHLHRVCDIAKKYGFNPMIWSDMFCKLAGADEDINAVREKAALPDNVTLVYWDYYSTEYGNYVGGLKKNLAFGRPTAFAGGAWTWRGFAPDNAYSIDATRAALKACKDNGVTNVFFTSWGDGGSECSKYVVLPALMYAAELYRGNDDAEDIKRKFKEITGEDFDAIASADLLDDTANENDFPHWNFAPCKFSLYNDPFLGFEDRRCYIGMSEYYAGLEKKYAEVAETSKYSFAFKVYENLCKILKYKSDLGLRTREAYKNGDKKALASLAHNDYNGAIAGIEPFCDSFRKSWMLQNKPFGFEGHERSLGALELRLKSCRDRILSYVNGEIDKIDELEEKPTKELYDFINK